MSIASTHPGRIGALRAQTAARENSSDAALIKRVAAGDRLAMQTLFARHRVAVYRWLLRLVNEEALAEDLLSEVYHDKSVEEVGAHHRNPRSHG